jgi:hypothetical protein
MKKAVLLFLLTATSLFSQTLTITTESNGTLNADYSTTKLYINELSNQTVPITITFNKNALDVTDFEIWTNLNNRNRATNDANNDGIHDGIIPPPAPNTYPPGYTNGVYPTNGYFYAIPVTQSNNLFTVVTNATRTGAYRLTARYKVSGSTNWVWYNGRDHCLVIAPDTSRNMAMYEINVFNASSTGTLFSQRSTFESLTDPTNNKVTINYLKNLGVNTLWFQPVHPIGIENKNNFDPGSPYAVKNFFEINEYATKNYNVGNSTNVNRALAMTAFTNFIAATDSNNILVLLDAPYNHTSYDCEITQLGINLMSQAGIDTSGWQVTDKIRDREARFYSRNDGNNAYNGPASSAGNVAQAPDRNDFGKWSDVIDVYYGGYSTLVTGYPDAVTSLTIVNNESDLMYYNTLEGGSNSNGAVTRAVWQYFAQYVPYWVEKTGVPPGSDLQTQTFKGVDGLRADFGQGLPPQCWEYIINVARSHKWNFIFMSESLDGGKVTYRSSRHIEVLNENIIFPFKNAINTTSYRAIFEERRSLYGQSLVLLNNISHDEEGYPDPWEAFIRFAVGSTIDGAPMVMYGQEIGTSTTVGFDLYEINFNKYIPNFKAWNSMMPQWGSWTVNANGVRNLIPSYSGAFNARQFSPALKSSNRYFLNRLSDKFNPNPKIFSVVKYEQAGASPNDKDVVFGFVNLDRNLETEDNFYISPEIADLIGIEPNKIYNAKNIAAYLGPNNEYPNRRNEFLWGKGITGKKMLSQGIFVKMNKVPTTDGAWATAPFEAQFLKLYETTPKP